MRTKLVWLAVASLVGLATPFVTAQETATNDAVAPASKDFSFLQITDIHLSPDLAREPGPPATRGADTIKWIIDTVKEPLEVPPYDITVPRPAFALATGDVTEYGVVDDTWPTFEKVFGDIPCPIYALPGNHDNTWVAMYDILRKRHGGVNYSFDRDGWHFVCISSASPQEPVPCIDGMTHAWLKQDLGAVPAGVPIVVALHHPIDSNEFTQPYTLDTFIDLLRDYNVALVIYGHGHGVHHKAFAGVDCIMGGTTFGNNAGFGLLSVTGDKLRYAYCYAAESNKREKHEKTNGWTGVMEKKIALSKPKRLFNVAPAEDAANTFHLVPAEGAADTQGDVRVEWLLDGETVAKSDGIKDHNQKIDKLADVVAGRHLLSVRAYVGEDMREVRTLAVHGGNTSNAETVWTVQLPTGFKAGPVLWKGRLIVADLEGYVAALDLSGDKPTPVWKFKTGGEILATPAVSENAIVFGSGDGKVYALDPEGRKLWSHEIGVPVYGVPLIDGDTVYVGDNHGRMHAFALANGKPRWTFERADFTIESKPCRTGDMLVFGAWDGYVYAVDAASGEQEWKALGPKSSEGKGVRYYSPADCGPVVLGGRLFVCDRGYYLATYTDSGELQERIAEGVASIALDGDTGLVWARTNDNHLVSFDASGTKIREIEVPAGRFPIPPTITEESIYICGNEGLLTRLDKSTGKPMGSYQTTPGEYVMGVVAAGPGGVCYVAGMDGTLTAVRFSKPAPTPEAVVSDKEKAALGEK